MRGLAASLLVHAAVISAGLIYLPHARQSLDSAPIVSVELVEFAEITSVRAAAPVPEETPDIPEEAPTIEDEIQSPPPQPAPPEEAESEPEAIDPEPEPVAETEPEPEIVQPPEPEPEPVRNEPRTVQPEPEAPSEPSLADLLGDLEREVADARNDAGTPDTGPNRSEVGAGNANTADIVTLFRSQAYRCWRTVADMPNPENLGVIVEVRLNRDGTLSSPPRVQDMGRIRGSGNPFWLTAAERAQTAVIECAPFNLPADRYSQWRLIEVNFHVNLAAG